MCQVLWPHEGGLRRREGTVRSDVMIGDVSVSALVLLWLDHIVLTCWASMVMSCSKICYSIKGTETWQNHEPRWTSIEACIRSSRKMRRCREKTSILLEGPNCKKANVEVCNLTSSLEIELTGLRRIMRLKECNRNVIHLKTRIFGTHHVSSFDLYTPVLNRQVLQQVIWTKKQFAT